MQPPELIPLAVRIALRNAVGGWGPYTVREIDDLFQSHGFSQRDPEVEDAGGERRTTAESYHARIDWSSEDAANRYLDLVDEVLEQYPESQADPASVRVGDALRRSLHNAGIDRDRAGRLRPLAVRHEAEATLAAVTEGIWTPDRIRLFFSHLSSEREFVGQLAQALNAFGFSCFVAHDAITPTRDWQDVIELALDTCDVLIAHVTPGFRDSDWTEQEVGWALGRGCVVVPIRAGADPRGFLGSYQALTLPSPAFGWGNEVAIAHAVAVAVFRRQRSGADDLIEPMVNVVVEAFTRSNSYEETRRRFELLRLVPTARWPVRHAEQLRRGAAENGQITDAILDGRPIPEMIEELLNAASL